MEIASVNEQSFEEFIHMFGGVFEKTPLVAASVWSDRPFTDVQSLHKSFCEFVMQLPSKGKAGLLRCYPDLASRHVQPQLHLTRESLNEHRAAGLLELSEEEALEIASMNASYKKRFGWPFVICARENKKAAILEGLRRRVSRDREEELETGIQEVCKIAWHRLSDMVVQQKL